MSSPHTLESNTRRAIPTCGYAAAIPLHLGLWATGTNLALTAPVTGSGAKELRWAATATDATSITATIPSDQVGGDKSGESNTLEFELYLRHANTNGVAAASARTLDVSVEVFPMGAAADDDNFTIAPAAWDAIALPTLIQSGNDGFGTPTKYTFDVWEYMTEAQKAKVRRGGCQVSITITPSGAIEANLFVALNHAQLVYARHALPSDEVIV